MTEATNGKEKNRYSRWGQVSNGRLDPTVAILREFASVLLPKIGPSGELYKVQLNATGAPQTGRQHKNTLKRVSDGTIVWDDKRIKEYVTYNFGSGPTYKLKGLIETAQWRFNYVKTNWETDPDFKNQAIRQAAACFQIPLNLTCVVVAPELFCRAELYDVIVFKNKMTPFCPYCKSNTYTSWKCWKINNQSTLPRRVVHCDGTSMPLIGGRYECVNRQCSGESPAEEKIEYEKLTKHTFLIWNKDTWKRFPDNVQKRYSYIVAGLGETNHGTTMEPHKLPTPSLATQLLDPYITFSKQAALLDSAFQTRMVEQEAAYRDFVSLNAPKLEEFDPTIKPFVVKNYAKKKRMFWPEFDVKKFKLDHGPILRDMELHLCFGRYFQKLKSSY